MINPRARDTAAHVSVYRAIGATSRRRALPKQIHPTRIADDYGKVLIARVHVIRGALAEFDHAMPALARRHDADEPNRVRSLLDRVETAIKGAFDPKNIEEIAKRFANTTSSYQRVQLSRQVKAALGIELPFGDKALGARIDGFAAENAALIKGLSRDTVGAIEKASLRAVQDGKMWGDLKSELEDRFGMSERRAKLIARDQIGKLYGQINADRQQGLGITSFVWRTVHDQRVRDEHEELDGKTFTYDDPPDEGLPGEPIQCRCSAEPVFDAILDQVNSDDASD